MRFLFVVLTALIVVPASAQPWHLNTEPIYFLLKAPNVALDRAVTPSLAVGFQYSALEWGKNGSNLSGFQVFYARNGQVNASSEILKLYAGRLSPGTSLLKIEAKEAPKAVFEVMYGYRWVTPSKLSVAVLAGTFFTTDRIYPSVSVPVGWMF